MRWVQVDGQQVLTQTTVIDPGKHKILAIRKGYEPYEQEIEVSAGEKFTLQINLIKLTIVAKRPSGKRRSGSAKKPASSEPAAKPKPRPRPKAKAASTGLLID
jgi:hypothetical protein